LEHSFSQSARGRFGWQNILQLSLLQKIYFQFGNQEVIKWQKKGEMKNE
jgi:hypothetical protein